ncbi:MAG: LysR family transcriptional regulator [Ectothiorhodospiraceae bacterium]|nr:LysR family transcriptional regulator [Ectothiorhodospiraceae bacterium]
MKPSLRPGLERRERVVVDAGRVIEFLGRDGRVYSTPSMVNDVEYACFRLLAEHLEPGESSVGVHVAVDHVAATPIGAEVEIMTRIAFVQDRGVQFEAEVRDGEEVVGRGRHRRVVVAVERYVERVQAKAQRLRRET